MSALATSSSSPASGGAAAWTTSAVGAQVAELPGDGRGHAAPVVGDHDRATVEAALDRRRRIEIDGPEPVAHGPVRHLRRRCVAVGIGGGAGVGLDRGRRRHVPDVDGGGLGGRGRGRVTQVVDPGDDLAERLELGQLLDHGVVDAVVAHGVEADPLGELADDLDALDGVDRQVGLEVEVGVEHVGGVPGAVGHDLEDHGEQRIAADPRPVVGGGRRGADVGGLDDLERCRRRWPAGRGAARRPPWMRRSRRPVRRGSAASRRARRRRPRARCGGTRARWRRGSGSDGPRRARGRGSRRRAGASRRTTAPAAVRTRWPSSVQPGARTGRVGRSTISVRPSNRTSVSTSTPTTASSASASRSRRTPGSPLDVAGDRAVGAVAEDLADELGEHPAGPGLDEHPRAGRVHGLDLVDEADRPVTWSASRPRTPSASVGYGAAVVLAHTGMRGAPTGDAGRGARPSSRRARRRPPGCGTRRPRGAAWRRCRRPRARRQRRRPPRWCPTSTTWFGPLWLATTTSSWPLDDGGHDVERGARPRPSCPGRRPVGRGVEDGVAARLAEVEQGGGVERAGGGQRDELAVAVPGGDVGADADARRAGRVRARPAMPSAGWATRVSVSAALLRGAVVGGEGGGRVAARSTHGAPVVEQAAELREGDEQVGEHAGALAALAGEEEGDGAAVSVPSTSVGRSERRKTPSRRPVPWRATTELGGEVAGSRSATMATCTGPDPVPRTVAARSRRRWRSAAGVGGHDGVDGGRELVEPRVRGVGVGGRGRGTARPATDSTPWAGPSSPP